MKHSDEADIAISKVLAGLRDVETPDGMERRILRQLEQRAAQRSTSWLQWSLPLAAVGTVACGMLVAVALRSSHKPAPIPPSIARVATSPMAAAAPANSLAPEQPHRVPTAKHRIVRSSKASEAATAELGFPAPPLPLTDEEKLLLRLAQGGIPKSVVLLDPEALAEREAKAEKDFRERMEQTPETVSATSLQAKLKNLDEGVKR
jgi:hypothetical protein